MINPTPKYVLMNKQGHYGYLWTLPDGEDSLATMLSFVEDINRAQLFSWTFAQSAVRDHPEVVAAAQAEENRTVTIQH